VTRGGGRDETAHEHHPEDEGRVQAEHARDGARDDGDEQEAR
jgi:hypothetical protein